MKTNEIRDKYLDFFKSKDHRVCESDVLVPKWDETVLFTPAGMNPFKDHFLGKVELEFTRATSSQKCLRTGDIENVGRTAYHHTFFEMLGNFSFGDYFKREAINWAWEFLTDKKWLAIPADRLTVTVFLDDDEAAEIWKKDIGLSLDRITRLDEHENFWPAGAPSNGPDGVCGPCSEIFFHPDGGEECEIWNLVFTQFNRTGDPPNNLEPLPSKNIDTGMGLERIASMLQGKTTNYHIDTLQPLVNSAAEVCGRKYEADGEDGRRIRRIADHVRACTMAIHENVYPDKQKENYVIRRLLRRAVLQGHEMGLRDPFLFQLVPSVVEVMAAPYPDLKSTVENVQKVIKKEELAFLSTLDDGLGRIEKIFSAMSSSGSKTVDGKEAFDLYQSKGIPAELFESLASEKGFKFDWDGYKTALDQHAKDSGAGQVGVMGDFGPIDDIKREVKSTSFVGYELVEAECVVAGLIDGDQRADSLSSSDQPQMIVLDQTPFYAESGGQVGDFGIIRSASGEFDVTDVQKNGDVFVHVGSVTKGSFAQGEKVTAVVDTDRRTGICRAHTATHILHHSLQQNLGSHAQQRGSKVVDDVLRFDFANDDPISDEQLAKIEQDTIKWIESGEAVKWETIGLEEARSQGAMMLFGEKYPDPVRMVSIGQFSKELCGGTHVSNSSVIDCFEIVSEDNISSGTRRIEAYTGAKAKDNQKQVLESVDQLGKLLGVAPPTIPATVKNLGQHVKDLKKQISSGKVAVAKDAAGKSGAGSELDYYGSRRVLRESARLLSCQQFDVVSRVEAMQAEVESLKKEITALDATEKVTADDLLGMAEEVSGIQVVVQHLPHSNPNLLRQLIDQVRKKTEPVALFLATTQGADKVILVAGISRGLVEKGFSAGDWVKEIAPMVGGGGGGKPDLAQAGGKQPENLKPALAAARDFMTKQLVS